MPSLGLEVCHHNCEGRSCLSPSTKTLEWKRAGNSLKRHTATRSKHPKCTAECPKHCNLQGASILKNTTRTAPINGMPEPQDGVNVPAATPPPPSKRREQSAISYH